MALSSGATAAIIRAGSVAITPLASLGNQDVGVDEFNAIQQPRQIDPTTAMSNLVVSGLQVQDISTFRQQQKQSTRSGSLNHLSR